MLDLLNERYTKIRRGSTADRYVRAEHVRSTQFYTGASIADFIAIDKYKSTQAIHGHEVKVSRSDWLTEVRNPEKAERVKKYCDYWWLVVPDSDIVGSELPSDWGLMSISKGTGALRVKKQAPRLDPVNMDLDFVVGLTAAVHRTAMREPLNRDAPMSRIGIGVGVCGWCGEVSPCGLHQPRISSLT